jgi:hypothetical protein
MMAARKLDATRITHFGRAGGDGRLSTIQLACLRCRSAPMQLLAREVSFEATTSDSS